MRPPRFLIPDFEAGPSNRGTTVLRSWFPASRLRHLCNLFMVEVADLRACHRRFEAEVARIQCDPTMSPLWPLARDLSRIHRARFLSVERVLVQVGIAGGRGEDPGIDGPERTMPHAEAPADHSSMLQGGAVRRLRRVGRAMDAACDSAAECASLLGLAELADALLGWAEEWRECDARFRREALRVALEAYMADTLDRV